MLHRFDQHIKTNFPFLEGKKLLIAISGGVDSIVLTDLMQQLTFDISLAHCNFNLRGTESDADEKLVKELGKKLDVTTFTTHFETIAYAKKHKLSTQLAARNLRYAWFDELIEKHQYDYLLTAHHADDNLETFIINLSRGSGLEGLTGIPAINKTSVRPLLSFSREDIVSYASTNNLIWREDKSNEDTKYLRNKIRHEIAPALKELNPSLLDSFQKTIEYLKESQQIIDDTIEKTKKEVFKEGNGCRKIDIKKIKSYSNPKAYLYQLLKEYNFSEWDDVLNLLDAQTGKQVFSATHRLVKDRDFILLSETGLNTSSSRVEKFLINDNTSEITTPIHLTFKKVKEVTSEEKDTIYLDEDKLVFPLTLRKWKYGDFFYPNGMTGKKKLSKFFKDEKLSLLEKEDSLVLCSQDDIVLIVNRRVDRRFTLTKDSKNIVKVSFYP